MTLNDAYYELSVLLNKNSERQDVNIDRINYAMLFNRESLRFIAEFIERNNGNDNILTLSELQSNTQLIKTSVKKDYVEYDLPLDFFKMIPGKSYSLVTGSCGDGRVYNWFKKPTGFNIAQEDEFTNPSFGWEQGLGELSGNKVLIYKTDFEINSTMFSYYRKLDKIDLQDPDYTQEIKLSDFLVGQINDRIASEVNREFANPNYNLAKSREQITI